MGQIFVTKGDGSVEQLDYNKIRHALKRSGASKALANEIIDSLASRIYQNMPTGEIYRMAYQMLSDMKPGAAARFGLRNALLRLGPDGYPFETFVGALLRGRGYETKLRQTLQGRCIQHEIDVVASRGSYMDKPPVKCIVECKFHNSPHYLCHVQSALYTWARFLDVREKNPDIKAGWLATNTKFSGEVIAYGDCVGLKLLGWSFPKDESIQVRIEENKLYPITLLPHLERRTFAALHEAGIITVKELLNAPDEKLQELGISETERGKLKNEAKTILSSRM